MRLALNYLFVTIFLISGLTTFAQMDQDLFEKLPQDLGLNNTPVIAMAQDTRGYIWFGTWVGLYRYDGSEAKLYTVKSNNITSNKIASILVTKSGELYFGTLRGGMYTYDYGKDDFVEIVEPQMEDNVLRKSIWALFEDKNGNIWVATEKGLAIYDSKKKELLNRDAFLKSEVNSKRVQYISDCDSDYIWVGTEDGLFCYFMGQDGSIKEMGHYTFNLENYNVEQSNFIFSVYKDYSDDGKVFVLCKGGIISLDYSRGFEKVVTELIFPADNEDFGVPRVMLKSSVFQDEYLIGTSRGLQVLSGNGRMGNHLYIENKIIRKIFEDNFGSLWVGTDSGLFKYNESGEFLRNQSFEEIADIGLDILEYMVKSPITKDVWLGWQSGIVSRLQYKNEGYDYGQLEHFKVMIPGNGILTNRISQIGIDNNGMVWLATQGSGLLGFLEKDIYNKDRIEVVKSITHKNGLLDDYLMSLTVTPSDVWLGSWNNGISRYNKSSGLIHQVNIFQSDKPKLKDIPVIEIINDANNSDMFYVGMRGEGVFVLRYNESENAFDFVDQLTSSGDEKNMITNNFITDLLLHDDVLYVCSESGLDIYNTKTKRIIPQNFTNVLPKSIMQSIIHVSDSLLWMSTYNDGFLELAGADQTFNINEYNFKSLSNYASASSLQVEDNTYLFGGANGFTILYPKKQAKNTTAPIPILTELRIDNETVSLNEKVNGRILLTQSIAELPQLKLDYRDKMISLGISILHTKESVSAQYAYKLDGFHDEWIYVKDNERLINFTNLPYKSYTLKFKAGSSDGIWSEEKQLSIMVRPPWWLTNWAYFGYFLLVLSFFYGLAKLLLLKAAYDHRIKLEKVERAKIEELNQLKLKFYTSISHELRTPLTMIISPLEQLISNPKEVNLEHTFNFMLRNAKKLLIMVNQLLDFRKHESGNLDMHLKKLDFIEFTNEIVISFQAIAQKKGIDLVFISELEKLYMAFDEDQIEKLYNNLISNAIKYTPRGGQVSVFIENNLLSDKVSVSIEDTGIGIDKEELDQIFHRFYQGKDHVHEGYGLGLSIVKSIVENHEGKIMVTSQKGRGTKMLVTLPTILVESEMNTLEQTPLKETDFKQFEEEIQLFDEEEAMILSQVSEGANRKMLIVEDNDEIKSYLKENFAKDYDISIASDGVVGLNIAINEVPDVIISDIAMPLMDGLEMCKKLKSNIITSHIPIILLTARTSIDFKMNGFDLGANAYVTKPFNMELLKKRVTSLLEYQDILKAKYKGLGVQRTFDPTLPEEESLDDKFIKHLLEFIEDNMSETDLTVDDIAKALLISRIQLYRKVKALTGKTPNSFLRNIRMKRAAQLLERTDFSISEITYKVGFNDLKYFREKFKDEFKMNPSRYRQMNKVSSSN